jgi:hypothetical protein
VELEAQILAVEGGLHLLEERAVAEEPGDLLLVLC